MTAADSPEPSATDPEAGRSVADLVRAVVAAAAEDELPFFDHICETYSADPKAAVAPQARDELAGFADFLLPSQLITPILIEAIAMLAVDSSRRAGKKAGKLLSRHARGKRSPVVNSPVATPDEQQIREVQDRVSQLSVQAEIPRDIVERVTLALYVELTGTGPEHPRVAP